MKSFQGFKAFDLIAKWTLQYWVSNSVNMKKVAAVAGLKEKNCCADLFAINVTSLDS
ncbi:hypothetical protein DPMN_032656 [Dreissena polymorpha]|uniref:Uncharacterized protein n=1 Tax=Dreissena polymorpha TaxID=45954 RepID=A0A9D4M5G3_DREPO|nr:hypothetical protein DPMN_032656 [Dreissena polymorpha]